MRIGLVLSCLLLAASHVFAGPNKGDIVKTAVQVGMVTVPLPAGEWTVVADQEGKTLTDGMPTGPGWKGMYLLQQDGDHRFVASFYIRASTSSTVFSTWSDSLCGRTDTLYRDTLNGTLKIPNCLLINHLTRYQQSVPSGKFDREVWDWLQQERVKVPQTVLSVQTRQYRFGDFLYVNYAINPEIAGFEPSTIQDWSRSEWHPAMVKNDPKRREYLEKVKTYAKNAAVAHEAALRGGTQRVDLEAIPR